MLDIRLMVDFADHDKTDDLVGIAGEAAVRCLLRLWSWAAEHRPKGILDGKTVEELERKAKWLGEPGAFIDACIRVKFIDMLDDGALMLHDWQEHQRWIVHAPERKEKALKASAVRWEKKLSPMENATSIAPSNAPSPNPSPTPNPNPSPNPLTANDNTQKQTAVFAFAQENQVLVQQEPKAVCPPGKRKRESPPKAPRRCNAVACQRQSETTPIQPV